MRKPLALLLFLFVLNSCSDEQGEKTSAILAAPQNKTSDYSYQLQGVTIRDPYHWLEVEDSPERNDWLIQQQSLTRGYFSKLIPQKPRDGLGHENTIGYHIVFPKKLNHMLYYLKQKTLSRQFLLERWNLSSNEAELTIELEITDDKPVASSLSPGGRYYGILFQRQNLNTGISGENRFQWRLFDLANEKFTSHELPETSVKTHLHWLEHNRSILISSGNQVIRQKLIPKTSNPQVIFDVGRLVTSPQDWSIDVQISTDNSALVLKGLNKSEEKLRYWVKSLELNDPFMADSLIPPTTKDYRFIGSHGDTFYFQTTLAASRGRIISINRSKPASKYWREVIQEQDSVLVNAKLINNEWLLHYVDNTKHQWFIARLNGESQKPLNIPHHTATKIAQLIRGEDFKVLLSSSNISTPGEIYLLDFLNGELKLLHSGRKSLAQLESKVFFYRSSDGSRIPLTLYSRGGLRKSEMNRVLISTHQGLGQHFPETYNYVYRQWLDNNGIVAIPHIRGGGTYGLNWHEATTSNQQIKAAEDLNAAIDWLVDKNYTSKPYVTALGENNAATTLLQAVILSPDKWSALVLKNPTADFIQYYQTNNKPWLNHLEIESSKQGVAKLLAMSPYHNFPNAQYPATLIIDTVTRSKQSKLVALWQNNQLADKPILLMNASKGLFNFESYQWPIEDLSYRFLKNESDLMSLTPDKTKAL
ncbi:prolyl oligopeptidase family serine peptidase [Kangiella sediminilitoris]|uniref:Prolyl oligopeptidase n=1 Tax=Kangiella sediminilitoris TaxID=1144748 RepID=A0A1B3BB89_9GAMM|nr:prolyl oligopeptidase family serine peptidase [Kangiella sediminilitoris]AOE50059.1 hypothetical protein KS2013_1346 [Kangiella sediminilitoris]